MIRLSSFKLHRRLNVQKIMSKPQKDNEKEILKVMKNRWERELRITMIKRCFNGAIERFINLEANREVKSLRTFRSSAEFQALKVLTNNREFQSSARHKEVPKLVRLFAFSKQISRLTETFSEYFPCPTSPFFIFNIVLNRCEQYLQAISLLCSIKKPSIVTSTQSF